MDVRAGGDKIRRELDGRPNIGYYHDKHSVVSPF
jgi:hypothetical protein